jgi:hypothetical protein
VVRNRSLSASCSRNKRWCRGACLSRRDWVVVDPCSCWLVAVAAAAGDQALEMFADNPFKVSIISTKIPDGGRTTAYRCGPLIDLCMGPHVPGAAVLALFPLPRVVHRHIVCLH